MVQGLGLTTSELMMARASAIKYAGKREKPTRLLDLTIRFGINFLTLAPVPKESLRDIRSKSNVHWNGVLESSADEDQEPELSNSSSDSELSVAWDPGEESQGMPATNTDEYTVAVTRRGKSTALLCLNKADGDTAAAGESSNSQSKWKLGHDSQKETKGPKA